MNIPHLSIILLLYINNLKFKVFFKKCNFLPPPQMVMNPSPLPITVYLTNNNGLLGYAIAVIIQVYVYKGYLRLAICLEKM